MAERKRERALETWSPFREFGFGGLGRVFDDLLAERSPAGRWAPALDVTESDGTWVLTMELPGAKREDVSIEVHEDLLTIRGEKKSEREESKTDYHLIERSFGSFSRSVRLPFEADSEAVKAHFAKGLLKVTIAKPAEVKEKTVKIPVRSA